MSFKQHAYPLHIATVPSRNLLAATIILHLLALVAIAVSGLNWLLQGAALLLLLGHFYLALRRCAASIVLQWDTEGLWHLRAGDRSVTPNTQLSARVNTQATLLGSSVISRYWVWLHLRAENGKFIGLLLLPDMMPTDVFRRLRVRLLTDKTKLPPPLYP